MRKRGNHDLMKEINARLVFGLIRQHSQISRIEISKETGLSKSTVSEIVDNFIQKNIVREIGSGDSIGGRRPILLQLNSNSRFSIGIQIDDYGDLRGVLLDLDSNILVERRSFCLKQEELSEQLYEIVDFLIEGRKEQVLGIGLAVPGIVDYQTGSIISAVNPGWLNVSLVEKLKARYNLPVYIENATGAIAVGEIWFGSGVNYHNMIYIGLGAVVGAAIIINGVLHRGKNSVGELGHTVISSEKVKCHCGRYGCLESLVSKPAIYRKLLHDHHLLANKFEINHNNVFTWLVESEASEDLERKTVGTELLVANADHLATALVNTINLLGTELIVIRSELTRSSIFMERLVAKVKNDVLSIPYQKVEIKQPVLAENAAVFGAAALVLQAIFGFLETGNNDLSVQNI